MWIAMALLLLATSATAAPPLRSPDGGGAAPIPVHDALDPAARAEIETRIAIASDLLPRPRGPVSPTVFGWPLRARAGFPHPGYHGVSNFFDHDPTGPNHLEDWSCGVRTYDLASGYDHPGTDFFTWPFGWARMENDEIEVVAAAAGTILVRDDGYFDGSCSLNPNPWNAIYLAHADGTITWYGHLKAGSLTAKGFGESVAAGEYLGVVGSSGSSTGPHLHFEVHDEQDAPIDPFQGPCQPEPSLWIEQPPYYDSALNQISTHDAEAQIEACNQVENMNERDRFDPGERVYFYSYYRDQLAGQLSTHVIRRPDGGVYDTWQSSSPAPHYASSYWYWSYELPFGAPHGLWRYELSFEGRDATWTFRVPEPAGATPIGVGALLALRALRQRGSKKGFQGAPRAASTSASDGARSRPAASAARVAARLLR